MAQFTPPDRNATDEEWHAFLRRLYDHNKDGGMDHEVLHWIQMAIKELKLRHRRQITGS